MKRYRYETICRVLRLTHHARRGVDLAMSETPPWLSGGELAAAHAALTGAVAELEALRGPYGPDGDPVGGFDDDEVPA
jgi:hypothetical protein